MKIKQIGMLMCASSAALASFLATAQEQQARPLLEEIVVTAEKREATLSDTAVAITAFTSNTMNELNITSPADYEALVPSLSYKQDPNRISIRGVGRFDNSLGVNPGVAIYNDYAYTAEATALGSRSMNTERVEILRGPQGTLYGRNTTGGAVNIITKRPPDEWTFEAAAKIGNYATKEFDALVGGPIAESLRVKLYMNDISHDGYQENLSGKDLWTNDTSFIEGQVSWDITDDLNLMVKYGSLSYDYAPARSTPIGGSPDVLPWDTQNFARARLDFSAQFGLTAENPYDDPYKVNLNDIGSVKLDDASNVTAHLTWNTDFAEIKYIVDSNKYTYARLGVDNDGTPNPLVREIVDIEQEQSQQTHELQIVSNTDGSIQWLAGLYSFSDDNVQSYALRSPTTPSLANVYYGPTEIIPKNPNLNTYYQQGDLDSNSWAAYGELGFDLSDTMALTVGLRYSDDEISGDEVQVIYANGALYGSPGIAIDFSPLGGVDHDFDSVDASHSQSWDNWSGHVTLDYVPTDDHLLWAKLATGYKMGGVRLGALQLVDVVPGSYDDPAIFDPEEVTMLELGWKGNFDGVIQLDTVLFLYDYQDLQQLYSFVNLTGQVQTDIVNTDMEMFGIELGIDYLIGDYFRLRGNYSYNSAEFTESLVLFDSIYGVNSDIKGNSNDQTPEHKLSLNGSYSIDTSAGLFYLGLTGSYVDDRYSDIFNRSETVLESYTRFDLLGSWTSLSESYTITAAVKNLTEADSFDNKTPTVVTTPAGVNPAGAPTGLDSLIVSGQPIAPRLFTVGIHLKF